MRQLVQEDRRKEQECRDRRHDNRLLLGPRRVRRWEPLVSQRQQHQEEDQQPRDVNADVDAEDARDPERSWHKASIASMRYLQRMRTMLDDRQRRPAG